MPLKKLRKLRLLGINLTELRFKLRTSKPDSERLKMVLVKALVLLSYRKRTQSYP